MTDQQKLIIFQMQKKYYQLRIKRELSKKNPNQSRLDQLRKEKSIGIKLSEPVDVDQKSKDLVDVKKNIRKIGLSLQEV